MKKEPKYQRLVTITLHQKIFACQFIIKHCQKSSKYFGTSKVCTITATCQYETYQTLCCGITSSRKYPMTQFLINLDDVIVIPYPWYNNSLIFIVIHQVGNPPTISTICYDCSIHLYHS